MSIAVVTGASSGIGYSLVDELASNGFIVYACARRLEHIKVLQDKHGLQKIRPYQLDISNNAEIVNFRKFLESEPLNGKIDLLYNNAGQACSFATIDVTDKIMEECFKVNVFGHINMTRELSRMITDAKGTIVFTGSIAGIISFPFITTYSATKAAIHQYARGLHLEMKPFGVRVINAITGGVETSIGETRPIPPNSLFNFPEGLEAFRSRSKKVRKMSSTEYAKQMVEIIMSSNDPVDIYEGSFATIARLISLFIPMWLLDKVLYKSNKLDKVESSLKYNKTKKAI
ncbi:similar to Saccharomyces cerevisiae YIL124W AYR1 NADPH-dependent 1-acyl dihydroxyacetone phosphate reductase found in lipid particles, ER, and mitochondrial outer membrane [Maudiozyma saulgeensis]|uniref:Similar to Saccharomyces cerevisiae YIL124W AYR1 NADPH-dependent 1-acyl dihydroxyacetone phosphate reductase found in lipid particles, ER, and mitochondrial outer membrane n=1 Tax=Maudiozyma saulgeensis TaxID=1789683 RepID=A0A1X7R8R6_9SACH|nr:similar to Saccharomyces cerevisiae YIL124W AYR1 NADPH-dependent 1-acyl dihydroxyacetone phosphate reductase found in lipid particles, ER, and mitochondrial outer membrane [Kazachstania saulgeensis]